MSRQSVWYYAKGMQKPRCVIAPKTTPQVRDLIGALTREHDEFCAAEIKKILKRSTPQKGMSTERSGSARPGRGWRARRSSTTSYSPMRPPWV
ncbi:hypothetical protein GDO78_021508 [Eleutherodactylus coqui]|uniref:Uncharacterized protein n=1 Tax=Eleutherodactylus coqui TaxID=57060 RepID=A0A8J6B4C4_ELECQ|nr:hypothetical protein GDO78_021508 [Eleutherodactylus coqui]